jgi:hypothetical protein
MMENIPLMLKEANRLFKNSDHLAYMTYPLVQDKRLLMRILESLNEALSKFMEVLLYYDFVYNRSGPVPQSFMERLDVFRRRCSGRYGIGEGQLKMIMELHEIVEHRKKSSMEFMRGSDYIIASDDFRIRKIGIDQLKKWINESKDFVAKVNGVVQ